MGGMIPVVVPPGSAIEGDTWEALIGLVGGYMGGNDGMLPVVVAVGKTMGLKAWEDLTGLVGGDSRNTVGPANPLWRFNSMTNWTSPRTLSYQDSGMMSF